MASDSTPKTIFLSGQGIQREGVAAGTIRPGMLIERTAAGKFQAHSTSGGLAQASFAVEYDLTGKTIDDNYAADDQVVYQVLAPGSHVYALIDAGETVAVGDLLVSDGNGLLIEADEAGGEVVIAQAVEAAGPGASATRVIVEILPATYVPAVS